MKLGNIYFIFLILTLLTIYQGYNHVFGFEKIESGNTNLVYPEHSAPFGVSMEDWTARWWQWAISVPENKNPLVDPTGEYNMNQPKNNPLFFLGGGYMGNPLWTNRNVTISDEQGILIPVVNSEWSYSELPYIATEAELKEYTTSDINNATHLEITLDGKEISYYRIDSDLFYVYFPENNVFKVKDVGLTQAFSDGYWSFIKPLPVGKHSLYVLGILPGYTAQVKYTIDVKDDSLIRMVYIKGFCYIS